MHTKPSLRLAVALLSSLEGDGGAVPSRSRLDERLHKALEAYIKRENPIRYNVTRVYDIPKPAWHKRAHHMFNVDGETVAHIAEMLGKNYNTVRRVLDPVYRAKDDEAKRKSRMKNGWTKTRKRTPEEHAHLRARQAAREQWREEGKKKPLDSYYRHWECL